MTTNTATFVPSTWKRLMARGLDQIFISMVLFPVLLMRPETEDGWIQLTIPWALFVFLYPLVYEALCLCFFQTTPGKWIFNLKVIPASAIAKKHWGLHALIRALVCYVGFFIWAFFATALWRYDRRHLADLIAETRVVGIVPTKMHKVRPLIGLIVVMLGLVQGWISTVEQIQSIDYEDGAFFVPDPTVFDFSGEEE